MALPSGAYFEAEIDSGVIDTANLTQFPLTIFGGAAVGKGGADIRAIFDHATYGVGSNYLKIAVVQNDNSTQNYVEVEQWNSVTKVFVLHSSRASWVISHDPSPAEHVRLYFNGADSDNTTYVGLIGSTPGEAVWDSNFKMVQHMSQDPSGGAPQMIDSTVNNNDGTSAGTMTSGDLVAGQIDGAIDFDGGDDYIGIGDSASLRPSALTMEAWVERDVINAAHEIIDKNLDGDSWQSYLLRIGSTNLVQLVVMTNDPAKNDGVNTAYPVWATTDTVNTAYHYLVGVFNNTGTISTAGKIYIDGSERSVSFTANYAVNAFQINYDAGALEIGRRPRDTPQYYFDGIIDEVRISNIARLPEWVKACNYSQTDALLTWGSIVLPFIPKTISAASSVVGTVARAATWRKVVAAATATIMGTIRPLSVGKGPEGVVAVTGAVARATEKIVAGSVLATGTIRRFVSKVVALGAATVIGTVDRTKIIFKMILGVVDATGVVIRMAGKTLIGGITVTGTMRPVAVERALAGAVAASGTIKRLVSKTLLGLVDVAGSLLRHTGKGLLGQAVTTGSIRPIAVGKVVAGLTVATGIVQRLVSKVVAVGQVVVGGTLAQMLYKTVATALATVAGAVTRQTGKGIAGQAVATGSIRPLSVARILSGLVTATGAVGRFLYDINYVMNQTIRRIYAKVRIAYSDPFFSGGVTTSANQVGRETYTDQTADEVETQYAKWFSLHRNVLDGSYHPMPSGKEHSVGWWGTALSDAVTRTFTPEPVLMIEFTARTIEELLVVGDDKLAEYPEDFTIRLYSAGDVLEYTEDVDGNNLVTWTMSLTPAETDIVKMTLTIEKWSRAEAVSKIAQFFTALEQTYYSEDGDLTGIRVLEERQYEAATIPQGDVSSSEITIRLNNIDDKFSAGNWGSDLYGLLKNNRAITAWLGVDMIPSGVRRWYPLGTFFSRDWSAPEDQPWAEVTGLDMLDRLRVTEFSTSTVYTNITLHDLAVTVMTDAGLTSNDWEIDPALDGAAYTIPYAWFDRMSHREALRRIAAGALGQCYCNRDGKIVIEIYSAPAATSQDFAFTRGNFFTVDHPLAWTQMINYVQARADPRVASAEQVICSDMEAFTIGAGLTVTKTHFFDTVPAVDVLIPVLTDADANIVVDSWVAYAWGVMAVYKNNGGTPEEVRQIDISGKPLEIQGGKIVVAQDAASIAANGKQTLGEPISSEFWQNETIAQASADALLAVYKDPRRDVMMRARGNIGLALGDRVVAPDYKDMVTGDFGLMRQDIDWDGGLEVVVTAQRIAEGAAKYYKTVSGKAKVVGMIDRLEIWGKVVNGNTIVIGTVDRVVTSNCDYKITSKSHQAERTTYIPLWEATSSDYVSSDLHCGQEYYTSPYIAYDMQRIGLLVETDRVPVGATLQNVRLYFWLTSKFASPNFDLVIQNGQPDYPHDPVVVGDYDKERYSGDGGSRNTADLTEGAWNYIEFNATGRSWIQKGASALTKLVLRNSREIAGTPPTGEEYVIISHDVGKYPYFEIKWFV